MGGKLKIGALISGTGTNLRAIMDACDLGKIDAEVVFAGADNHHAKGLERSAKLGIPTFVVDYAEIIKSYKNNPDVRSIPKDFDLIEIFSKQSLFCKQDDKAKNFIISRVIAEAKMLEKMLPFQFDLLVLAGFMRNLTPYFIDRININPDKPRIMNIHPALLPSFPGTDGYGDTFRYGCKTGGCTVHFIDYGEDSGPIIAQRAFPIYESDTIDSVKEKGLKLEWELFPECIQMFRDGRLETIKKVYTLENGKTYERTIVKIK